MPAPFDSPVRLAVLNPGGRDPHVDYREGPGSFDPSVHAPVNYHGFAACTFGAFFDSTRHLRSEVDRFDAVLLLIRRRAWITLAALKELRKADIPVMVAWKECGHTQIAQQLQRARSLLAYQEIVRLADAILTPTMVRPPRCGPIDHDAFERKLAFVPAPYPLDFPEWDFSVDFRERHGVMIGTREFGSLMRNHIHAISHAGKLAHELDLERVTVINSERSRGRLMLRELGRAFPPDALRVVDGPLPYPSYMTLLAQHRLVFQMDRSGVPGQVSGDSLLARTLCAGGNSTNESIAFPELCDDGTPGLEQVHSRIARAMSDDDYCRTLVDSSRERALENLSFSAVARRLGEIVDSLASA